MSRTCYDDVKTVMASGQGYGRRKRISFTDVKFIGRGTFGTVYRARLLNTGETVAIKKVVLKERVKNRELEIMKQLDHRNIVKLMYSFYDRAIKEKHYLHLMLEFFPTSLFRVMLRYEKKNTTMPPGYIMVYTYQMFRGLAYLHSLGIAHRDVKPDNILLNEETMQLKLCDFGNAKHLEEGKTNESYMCTRSYRAPELLLQAKNYTTMIDMWSAGCILVELEVGQKPFEGEDSYYLLTDIMSVLGKPTRKEMKDMNQDWKCKLPVIKKKKRTWLQSTKSRDKVNSSSCIDLASRLLVYTPSARLTPLQACAHGFYDLMRNINGPWDKELLSLFIFSEHELKIQPDLNAILVPQYLRDRLSSAAKDSTTEGMETEPSTSMDCTPTDCASTSFPPPPTDYSSTAFPPTDCASIDVPQIDCASIDFPPIECASIDIHTMDCTSIDFPPIECPSIDIPAMDCTSIDFPPIECASIDLPPMHCTSIDSTPTDYIPTDNSTPEPQPSTSK